MMNFKLYPDKISPDELLELFQREVSVSILAARQRSRAASGW
jgi:hypothetical protein